MSRNRYTNIVNKTLLNKEKLLKAADKCNFYFTLLVEKNRKEACSKLYQSLSLNFKGATKQEKRNINTRFSKVLLKADVSNYY